MTTRTDMQNQTADATHVADMPPLTVTTVGIPDTEHVDPMPTIVEQPVRELDAPSVEPATGAAVVDREQRTRWYALAFSGVVAALAVLALVWGAVVGVTPSTPTVLANIPQESPMSEWPPRLTPSNDGYGQWGSTMSEWPTGTPAGWGELGSPTSEWPPRVTPSTDGFGQWGSSTSEWPPKL